MTNRQTPVQTGAAVLMGGGSTRMGSPKQHVDVAGTAMGQRVIELGRACCDLLLVSGPDDAMPGMEHVADLPAHAGFGPLAGIEAVLASGRALRWIVLPCDMPDLTPATIKQLLESTSAVAALGSQLDPARPLQLPLAVDASLLCSVSAFLGTGQRAVGTWLETVDVHILPAPSEVEVHNINTPEDLIP